MGEHDGLRPVSLAWLTAYGETEAAGFLAVDLVVRCLLTLLSRRSGRRAA